MPHRPRRYEVLARLGYWVRLIVRSWVLPTFVLLLAAYIALAIVSPPLQAPLEYLGFSFPAVPRFEVAGVITDSKSQPVVGAIVQVGGYLTHTDSAGAFILRFPSTTTERIALVVTAPGHGVTNAFFDADSGYIARVDLVIA